MKQKRSFTLVELIVTLIIVGILAATALPLYNRAVERARDREAVVNLRLMSTAEKIYRSRIPEYADCATTGNCNSLLGLDLSNGGNWSYSIPAAAADSFTAQACLKGDCNKKWEMDEAGTLTPTNRESWNP